MTMRDTSMIFDHVLCRIQAERAGFTAHSLFNDLQKQAVSWVRNKI